jgi:formate hydrogenlyase subunit 6/NADH:ubiquinone oxidoreductase subunit I
MSLRPEVRPPDDTTIREVERRQLGRFFRIPTFGILQAMKVTMRQLLSRAVTVHYPEERVELPPRTRGVIALLEENCTVCMLCSKDCPCWCIYIEGHKEQKPGRRKPVNALDRFAIDYGLCMYCGICVEVCPFDALHWSPAFEYTSYTYEGLIHELDVLTSWEHHVLPPPELVDDAEDKAKELVQTARDKREQGVWAVIREKDKQEAYQAQMAAQAPAAVVYPPAVETAQPAVSPDTSPQAAPVQADLQAPASGPPPAAAEAAAPQATPLQAAAPGPVATTAAAAGEAGDTFGLPRVDPMNLPDGINAVERGRLKKLAVFQERGHQPPEDLVQNLKHLLDRM